MEVDNLKNDSVDSLTVRRQLNVVSELILARDTFGLWSFGKYLSSSSYATLVKNIIIFDRTVHWDINLRHQKLYSP